MLMFIGLNSNFKVTACLSRFDRQTLCFATLCFCDCGSIGLMHLIQGTFSTMPLPMHAQADMMFLQNAAAAAAEPMELDNNEADPQFCEDDSTFPAQMNNYLQLLPQAHQQQEVLVSENPLLDLDQYAQQYTGMAKMKRLLYVADHAPQLRMEALGILIKYIKEETLNVAMYQEAQQKLAEARTEAGMPPVPPVVREREINPILKAYGQSHGSVEDFSPSACPDLMNDLPSVPISNGTQRPRANEVIPVVPALAFDGQWVEHAQKRAALKLEKLDTDLKHYKSNSIKESIRRGQDDLGEHYLDMGDLSNALKCFSRARDYCTSNKHVLIMCFNVIKVSAYSQNWSLVLSYVSRAENLNELSQPQPQPGKEAANSRLQALSKLKAAAGVAEMANRKYKVAAKHFLQVSFDALDYPELISAQNIAAYGALCALATFDRAELQKLVISNTGFKQFLELEPQLNDVIRKFNDSEYDACLTLLEQTRDNLLLDAYLAPHVRTLYHQVRNRGLIQYFSPYLSADMRLMATSFKTRVDKLEDEIIKLILDGQIKARIDSHNKVLIAKDLDQRSFAYERALATGRLLQQRAKAMMLRAAVQRAKVCVKQMGRAGVAAGSSNGYEASHSRSQSAGPSSSPSTNQQPSQAPVVIGTASSGPYDVAVTPSNSGQSSPQLDA